MQATVCPPTDPPFQCRAFFKFRGRHGVGRTIVTELRAQFDNGVLMLCEVSQASVLARALDNVPKDLNALQLEELSVLSSSAIFVNVWQQAGMSVLRELNRELLIDDEAQLPPVESIDIVRGDNAIDPPGQVPEDGELDALNNSMWNWNEDYEDDAVVDSREEEGTEDQQADRGIASPPATLDGGAREGAAANPSSLDLDAVITRVIPVALMHWQDLVDRICCGEIEAQEAWVLFSDLATHQEEEVRRVFASAAAKRLLTPAVSQTAGAARFLAALEAYASVKWFLHAVPKLLDAQVVLYSTCERVERFSVGANAANPCVTASTGDESKGEGRVADSESSSSAIFAKPLDADASRAALEELLKTLQMRWTHFSIGGASAAWSDAEDWGPPVVSGSKRPLHRLGKKNPGVLGGCRRHVDLLSALSAVPDLVDWLVKVCIL